MTEDISKHGVKARVLVAGQEADPRSVGVQLGRESGDAVAAQLLFGAAMLAHELREAGIDVSDESLEATVSADLARHKDVAISAYLNLAKYALFPEKPSHWWASRRKAETPVAIRWWWTATMRTTRDGDTLTIEGRVVADRTM